MVLIPHLQYIFKIVVVDVKIGVFCVTSPSSLDSSMSVSNAGQAMFCHSHGSSSQLSLGCSSHSCCSDHPEYIGWTRTPLRSLWALRTSFIARCWLHSTCGSPHDPSHPRRLKYCVQYGTCCDLRRSSRFSCTNWSYIVLLGGGCRSGSDLDPATSVPDAVPSVIASVAGVAVCVLPFPDPLLLPLPLRPPFVVPLLRRDPFEYSDPLPRSL